MRKYIVDLTNYLISRNHLDHAYNILGWEKIPFLKQAAMDLLIGDVAKMNPATLGNIMASFEPGDVRVTRQEIFENIIFSGDCENFLREIVSFCLAAVIFERLNSDPEDRIPSY